MLEKGTALKAICYLAKINHRDMKLEENFEKEIYESEYQELYQNLLTAARWGISTIITKCIELDEEFIAECQEHQLTATEKEAGIEVSFDSTPISRPYQV